MQMNIQELQMLFREQLPIKIVVLNNQSLGMIRHFQEMYFTSNYAYTKRNTGYTVPNFSNIARAYGLASMRYISQNDMPQLQKMLQSQEPCLIEVQLEDATYTRPKSVYNLPLSQQEPPLDALLQETIDKL